MIKYEDELKRRIEKSKQSGDYYRALSLYEYNGMYGLRPEQPHKDTVTNKSDND